jgi:hypothetical protein
VEIKIAFFDFGIPQDIIDTGSMISVEKKQALGRF